MQLRSYEYLMELKDIDEVDVIKLEYVKNFADLIQNLWQKIFQRSLNNKI